METGCPIKVLTQEDDDGDEEDGDYGASPTENDAMDRGERGDEDNDVGLNDYNADGEALIDYISRFGGLPKEYF